MAEQGHGGLAITRALKHFGVDRLFTLTGGHIFPMLDAAHLDDWTIIDTRHEQTATFAAEGWARLTRSLGVAAVTAGPGVTNAMSAIAQGGFNGAPLLVLGGRAPQFRWGQGSLQEIDHVPFVSPLADARTVASTDDIGREVIEAAQRALTTPRRPQFLDFPLDVVFNSTELDSGAPSEPKVDADLSSVDEVARLLEQSERPMLIAGSNVWLDGAEKQLVALVEAAEIPVFMNGQGRGCVPADHRLAFSRARSAAIKQADLVIVAGTPMDFRLGFGQFGDGSAPVVHLDSATTATHVDLAAAVQAPLDATLGALAEAISSPADTKPWLETLLQAESQKEDAAKEELHSSANPIHPMRIYGELVPLLERDAIVICDGGDFASYAGREIQSYEPGCWLDPGPFGCLGVGPGYAMAARSKYPDRQVVILYGDGAAGFSGMEWESFVRLGLPVVCVVGNNGIWGLEKHPMRGLYGYDVAADLRPGTRYDKVMEAFGGKGELVADPDEVGPALGRALGSGEPYLVNVITDPDIAYPRSSNLA